jgi:NADPH:quinone reductase-like Zn-dependent oxidoreductase
LLPSHTEKKFTLLDWKHHMRAIALKDSSSAPGLLDIPRPAPGPGQVLVRVEASSLNGFDIAVAAGYLQGMMEHRYPVVLGKDFAGVVEAIGEGASKFSIGDQVFGVVMTPYLGEGGFGDYVIVSEQLGIAKIPDGLSITEAGALGLAGAAAVASIDAINPQAGQTILIVGATGGVGAIATQYAASTGANVIATAKSGTEADFVKSQGAQIVVDPTGDLAAQVQALSPSGLNAILHLAGDASALPALLGEGGKIASTLGFGPDKDPAAIAIIASANEVTLNRLAADVVANRIHVPITRTYELNEVVDAIKSFPTGTLGKLAVKL